ncbi:MAG: alpha-amylase [Candidatus Rokuibacteriota bacterium]|nr:MAG: alpha-amylase [Candidatus Rokubacteria bacterium]
MTRDGYPSLFQINTRVWLTELSRVIGRPATLNDIPDVELDRVAEMGFDWVWLLSVWQTGEAGRRISRSNPEWRREFQETLPDLREEDIPGSGFAITGYTVRAPANYVWVKRKRGDLLLAHGRDPYFAGWPDTLQLNYGNPALQDAMIKELVRIAGQCDGVRCDMAMLVLPEVFERTWSIQSAPFWPKATQQVRARVPDFCFMAEVYWDLEWTLQQQGFDYAYDKRLYDRLREGHARPVREHLYAGLDYQNKLARFLENHDEPRAAAVFSPEVEEAAAVITFLTPGLRFFHQGQFEGRRKRISPHLSRRPDEPVNPMLEQFYARLLAVLRRPEVRDGRWQLLDCRPAWDGNWTSDCFVAFAWQGSHGERLVVTVNYSPNQSQCYVRMPFNDLGNGQWRLENLIGDEVFDRGGTDVMSRGLYLDVPAWKAAVFAMTKRS